MSGAYIEVLSDGREMYVNDSEERAQRRLDIVKAYHSRGNMAAIGQEFGVSSPRVQRIIEKFISRNFRGLTSLQFRKLSIDWNASFDP